MKVKLMNEYRGRGDLRGVAGRGVTVIKRAHVLYAPSPRLPCVFRRGAANLSVDLLFRVAIDGSSVPGLLRSSGYSAVDAAVLDAAVHWRFAPAIVDRRPVESFLRTRLSFPRE